uniref:Uncharacterized protein n=1 Tax=Arundo donax TaxID=35708 RepID=A0A0A9GNI6_ARUDO
MAMAHERWMDRSMHGAPQTWDRTCLDASCSTASPCTHAHTRPEMMVQSITAKYAWRLVGRIDGRCCGCTDLQPSA